MRLVIVATACLCVVLAGCPPTRTSTATQQQEQATTENQQAIHLQTMPPPVLKRSQERKNLIERLERFNTDSKVSYIYLVNFGKVMAFYPVKGKVSSVNSLLTTPEQIKSFYHTQGGDHSVVVASPDLDGSYGSNGDAVFFFTTDGTYVEWSGDYMLCDKPLKLSTPPELVLEIKE
jgi:hypothetical protein